MLVSEAEHPFWEHWWPPGHIIGWEHTFVHELHHLLTAIRDDGDVAPHGATLEDGYRAAEVCDAIVRSARVGRARERALPQLMAEARFEGRRALVTGAGSGIGEAVARALHAEGADVVLADAVGERVDALAGELGARARALTLDVREEEAVAAAMGELDVLVNVAGVGSTTSAPDTPLEVWENVFAVNARGTFLCCKHAIPGMVERGGGAIVNIASVAGLVGLPNRAAYCASKGAVIALTRALAIDHVRQGVRVNAVCPGTVDSPWVRRLVEDVGESLDALRARQPMGRLGTTEEVAQAVLYLASDDAAFVTGTRAS